MLAVLAPVVVIALVSVSLARNDRAGAKLAPGPRSWIPAPGARLSYGASVRGRCVTVDHAVRNDMQGWGVYTFDPAHVPVIGAAGRTLLPSSFAAVDDPPGLDHFASSSTRPADLTEWQVAGVGREMPASPGASCAGSIAVDSTDAVRSGSSIVLQRPGPYVYWTLDHEVHWTKVSDRVSEPVPRACAQDPDQAGRSPQPVGSPPSADGEDWHWAVDSFCTTVRWWNFFVLGSRGQCSTTGSRSSSAVYVNQYLAGLRLRLPRAQGRRGGNACGPSSLLMAMRLAAGAARSGSRPPLQRIFDQTMLYRRNQLAPDTIDDFVGSKAAIFLRHHGWHQATLGRLGTNADEVAPAASGSVLDPSNQARFDRALQRGPVILSTDLGIGRWGTTGDGHMIVVTGRARSNPDEYVVYDPAGNYFANPVNHYGPSSCGAGVLYPASWLLAYATGAWYLELGPRRA